MSSLINHGTCSLGLPTRSREGVTVGGMLRPGERRDVPEWYLAVLGEEPGWVARVRRGTVEIDDGAPVIDAPAEKPPKAEADKPKPPKRQKPPKAEADKDG